MHTIATAAHDTGVALDNPFMLAIIVAAVGVTGSVLALLGAFALVATGRDD
ncbi:multisubunit Na+/H+ antiporter MnhG subunit [Agrococcus sp. UYP10]|uniref:hypothetical protein n=1 Tax=Agrococcus sp. UYP10 TaxID=1756355 RepID=UPI003391ED4D